MATYTVKALHISSPKNDRVEGELVPGVALKLLTKELKAEGSRVNEIRCAKADATRMMEFYAMRNIPAESVMYEHGGKQVILEKIKIFFEESGTHFILSYSGHGCALTDGDNNKAGAWVFQTGTKRFEELTLQEITDAWDNARNGQGPRGLMIISDSCHSGELVKQVNSMPRKDICIQAACRAEQMSYWDTNGSVFTTRFVNATHKESTGKSVLNMLTFDLQYMFTSKYKKFTPISSRYSPSGFGEIVFFNSFAYM